MGIDSHCLGLTYGTYRSQHIAYFGIAHTKLSRCDRGEFIEHLNAYDAARSNNRFGSIRFAVIFGQ
jgi:hypothetical protein